MTRIIVFTFFVLLTKINVAQAVYEDRLVAGIMQGHTTATTTNLWLMVMSADSVKIVLKDTLSSLFFEQWQSTKDIKPYKHTYPITFHFTGLQPHTVYQASIQIDDRELRKKQYVSTFKDGNSSDFSFTLGSCALWVPRGLWWAHPGAEELIYIPMKKIESDFMVWLGDYLYYMPSNYRSPEGMYKKQVETRRWHELHMAFVKSRPQYSFWDDHEYGWNNSDKDFPYKKEALELQKMFWPNPTHGEPDNPGCYFSFTQQDAEFFMTDCRYYRTKENISGGEMLGKKQMQWLKNKLKESTATFKFICVGSQVLNEIAEDESYKVFPEERKEMLEFIEAEKLTGVIFLTGDRHHTELIKKNRENAYPLYDFTSSPITSFRRKTSRSSERDNPDRVPNTLVDKQNFGRITIDGPAGNRVCTMFTYNNLGKLEWEYKISENDLKFFK